MARQTTKKASVPLANIVAEKALLGAILRSEHEFFKVADMVRSDHFTVQIHQEIFAVVADLCLGGRRLSQTVIVSRLPEEFGEEGQSTAAYLSALIHNATDLSVVDFADQVADIAGRRQLLSIAETLVDVARKGEMPAIDAAAEAEQAILDVMNVAAPKRPRLIGDVAELVMRASAHAKDSNVLPGFDTGLPSVDEVIGLIMPGDLGVVLAAQGDGKSAIATQIGLRLAASRPVLMLQLEMTAEAVAARELAARSDVSVGRLRQGQYDAFDNDRIADALKSMRSPQFYIHDEARMTMRQIRAIAIGMKRTRGLGLLIIDHMRLVKGDGRFRDKFERLESVTADGKELAKALEVPVILLAQRTRGSQRRDDPTPQVDDAEAPSLEQDADWILGVWRKKSWLIRQKPGSKMGEQALEDWKHAVRKAENEAEIIGLKVRSGPPLEQRSLRWDGPRTRFSEWSDART